MSPLVKNPTAHYIKSEFYGKTNSGKSRLAYSICEVKSEYPVKKEIIVFSNEATFSETLAEFPEYLDRFKVYQHRNLNEFEADWNTFCEEYRYKTVANNRGYQITNASYVEKHVHAVIVDEAEFIYREGYVSRHAALLKSKGFELKPKDYGVPRRDFIISMGRIVMLPCHTVVTAKVSEEYESFRSEKRDGTLGALQFRKTGGDVYRLPDNFSYLPSVAMHLFAVDVALKEGEKPEFNEAGQLIVKRKYWGKATKQKADRDAEFVIRNPTMKKIQLKLAMLRKARIRKKVRV